MYSGGYSSQDYYVQHNYEAFGHLILPISDTPESALEENVEVVFKTLICEDSFFPVSKTLFILRYVFYDGFTSSPFLPWYSEGRLCYGFRLFNLDLVAVWNLCTRNERSS